MFTWICPKCGKEVPPSYSECPNCAVKEQAAPEAEAAAQAPPPAPAEPAASVAAPPVERPRRATRLPGWATSLLFAMGFALTLAAGFWAYNVLMKPAAQQPARAAAAPFDTPAATPAPAVQASPAFRNIELTGLRLTEDKQKAFLQFVVVNHSGADLGEVSAKVNLKAVTGKQDQEPVGTFSFRTSLGPYEAKDLKVSVQTKLRVYELPDWQFLRAEVLP